MATTIAVSGKGGVGKSTLAALIIRHLMHTQKQPVLAVDADPNSNLSEQLGLEMEETIGDIREEVQQQLTHLPPGMTKETYLTLRVQECVVESRGVDLLTMGRQEGPGCYCYVNHLLRGYLDGLAKQYGYVVVDNEAGMEHLSRRTTQDVDFLLIVSDPSAAALQAAARIRDLAARLQLKVGRSFLVLNRWNGDLSPVQQEAIARTGLELLGTVPLDDTIQEYSFAGQPLVGLPEKTEAVQVVGELVTKMLEEK